MASPANLHRPPNPLLGLFQLSAQPDVPTVKAAQARESRIHPQALATYKNVRIYSMDAEACTRLFMSKQARVYARDQSLKEESICPPHEINRRLLKHSLDTYRYARSTHLINFVLASEHSLERSLCEGITRLNPSALAQKIIDLDPVFLANPFLSYEDITSLGLCSRYLWVSFCFRIGNGDFDEQRLPAKSSIKKVLSIFNHIQTYQVETEQLYNEWAKPTLQGLSGPKRYMEERRLEQLPDCPRNRQRVHQPFEQTATFNLSLLFFHRVRWGRTVALDHQQHDY